MELLNFDFITCSGLQLMTHESVKHFQILPHLRMSVWRMSDSTLIFTPNFWRDFVWWLAWTLRLGIRVAIFEIVRQCISHTKFMPAKTWFQMEHVSRHSDFSAQIFDDPLWRQPQLCVRISRENFGTLQDHPRKCQRKKLLDCEIFANLAFVRDIDLCQTNVMTFTRNQIWWKVEVWFTQPD